MAAYRSAHSRRPRARAEAIALARDVDEVEGCAAAVRTGEGTVRSAEPDQRGSVRPVRKGSPAGKRRGEVTSMRAVAVAVVAGLGDLSAALLRMTCLGWCPSISMVAMSGSRAASRARDGSRATPRPAATRVWVTM